MPPDGDWLPLAANAKVRTQFVFHNGRHADIGRRKGLQARHHQRVAAKVVADGVAVENQHGRQSKTQARNIGCLRGRVFFAQGKIGKSPRQQQAISRPLMGGVFADDFRHPTTFRQAIGLRGLLHQCLSGIVQI